MNTYFGFYSLPEIKKGSVITLGVFDGVHTGHRQVINKTVELASEKKCPSFIITFDTHPRGVVEKNSPPMITSLKHRLKMFEDLKVDNVIVLTFHEEFSELTAEVFLSDILIKKLKMETIVLGDDAHFGKDRKGNIKFLEEKCKQYNYEVISISQLNIGDDIISSTAIRSAVKVGDLKLAEKMLGRPVIVMGTVAAGSGIGRTFGFPTLNLDLHHELHPPKGVYITLTCVGATCWPSVTNIGNRPTIDAQSSSDVFIESHIMQSNIGELYGQIAEVKFLQKIRDEKKFHNKEDLIEAIAKDVITAQDYFSKRG